MKELEITVEDLKGKIKKLQLQILKDKYTTFKNQTKQTTIRKSDFK